MKDTGDGATRDSAFAGLESITKGKVAIAAHHYQRPEIVARAALTGDSYRLAVAASRSDAEYIVLCGVRFMAESAAILAREGQKVLIPDMNAGCPMADMIDRGIAENTLSVLAGFSTKPIIPVVYMNSHADLKALSGERGGSVCTSGNARKILAHYLENGNSVFFAPDFNLGMNTARDLGIPTTDIRRVTRDGRIVRIDAQKSDTKESLERVRLFLWDGFCHVHKAFTTDDVAEARKAFPGSRVIVHPECSTEVVALADEAGSTESMYNTLRDAEAGSSWIIGTEGRFVERMAATFSDKTIRPLRVSYCHNMNRIDEASLDKTLSDIAWSENNLKEARGGAAHHRIPSLVTVVGSERQHAKEALDAMVRITESGK